METQRTTSLKLLEQDAPSARFSADAMDAPIPLGLDQLENCLQGELGGRVRQLRVVYRDNGLVLRGFARTYYAKQIAQHALMQRTRVPILLNEIEVA